MKDNHSIYRIAWLFIFIFGALIAYIAYFTVVESKVIAVHPYNKRLDHLAEEVVRGNIYDSEGTPLAIMEEGERVYLYDDTYSHVVGYSTRGKYGIEALGNVELLYPDYSLHSLFSYAFNGTPFNGHHVVTTLEHPLQLAAEEALGKRKGAVVVLEPKTGKIKAMYANPTFNPNTLMADWEILSTDETSPLLNRATQGLYPPASVFKIVTTVAALENNAGDFVYECTGSIDKNGHTITCYDHNAHGTVDLEQAFTKSCNTYFVALSDRVSPKTLQKVSEQLLFNTSLSKTLVHSKSSIELDEADSFDTLAAYIGQGTTLTTPLHLAMIASIVYNDGVLMAPYVIDYSMDDKGNIAYKSMPDYQGVYMEEHIAQQLKAMMIQVVTEGTASRIAHSNWVVGGKTGTAQNETAEDHSWFVGFAEHTEKQVEPMVFAIIVEQGGRGAQALDVADALLHAYFD